MRPTGEIMGKTGWAAMCGMVVGAAWSRGRSGMEGWSLEPAVRMASTSILMMSLRTTLKSMVSPVLGTVRLRLMVLHACQDECGTP